MRTKYYYVPYMFLSLFILFREVLLKFMCVWRHVNVKKMTLDFEAKKALIIDFLFYEFLIQNWMKKKYVKIDCQ